MTEHYMQEAGSKLDGLYVEEVRDRMVIAHGMFPRQLERCNWW